jgi:hypothetical protein
MPPEEQFPPEPWGSFLRELDEIVADSVDLHCVGGFVATRRYGFAGETQDIDVVLIRPNSQCDALLQKGGKGSELHKKHKVYLDQVSIIQAYPGNYDERITAMYPGQLHKIRLFAVEAHDLALMKLERNIERDREDVKFLARQGFIQPDILQQRYAQEMRPYVAAPEKTTDRVLDLWIEMIREHLHNR